MKTDKRTKLKVEHQRQPYATFSSYKKYNFNISSDNLRCFISSNRRVASVARHSQKSVFEYCSERLKGKYLIESSDESDICSRKECTSPDLSRYVSNYILQRIEKNGIKCRWKEEVSKEVQEDEDWPTEKVWYAFSDCQKTYSFASTVDHHPTRVYHYSTYLNGYSPASNCYPLNNSQYPYHYNGGVYQYPYLFQSQYYCSYTPYLRYQYLRYPSYMRYQNEMRYYDLSQFVIDIDSIGRDTRTTLMIKNIPNKYSIQNLSAEIDYTHINTYDFLYLPWDAKVTVDLWYNNCNVGYGFINFGNTDALKSFYDLFHNKKWLKFRSEKICMLTYARLQGLSNLIEHFQNSKVLNNKDKKHQPIIRSISRIEQIIRQQQSYK